MLVLYNFFGFDQFTFHDISLTEPVVSPDKLLNLAVLTGRNFSLSNCFEVVDDFVPFKVWYFFLYHFCHHFQVIFKVFGSNFWLKFTYNIPIFCLFVVTGGKVFRELRIWSLRIETWEISSNHSTLKIGWKRLYVYSWVRPFSIWSLR